MTIVWLTFELFSVIIKPITAIFTVQWMMWYVHCVQPVKSTLPQQLVILLIINILKNTMRIYCFDSIMNVIK